MLDVIAPSIQTGKASGCVTEEHVTEQVSLEKGADSAGIDSRVLPYEHCGAENSRNDALLQTRVDSSSSGEVQDIRNGPTAVSEAIENNVRSTDVHSTTVKSVASLHSAAAESDTAKVVASEATWDVRLQITAENSFGKEPILQESPKLQNSSDEEYKIPLELSTVGSSAQLHETNILHTDDSMTSLDSLDVTPNCSTANFDAEYTGSAPSFGSKEAMLPTPRRANTTDQNRERGSHSSDCSGSCTTPPRQNDLPQTILANSPRVRVYVQGSAGDSNAQLHCVTTSTSNRRGSLTPPSYDTSDADQPNEPSKTRQNSSESVRQAEGNIRGMSSLLPESSEIWHQTDKVIHSPPDGSRQELTVIGDRIPLVKSPLHRSPTERKSNVTSFEPVSLLDDDQSSCSDRALNYRHQSILQAATDRHRQSRLQQRQPIPVSKSVSDLNSNCTINGSFSTHSQPLSVQQMPQPPMSVSAHPTCIEEKKDNEDPTSLVREKIRAKFCNAHPSLRSEVDPAEYELKDCLSATESEVASFDGLPSGLQQRWLMGESPREKMLQSLDGIHDGIHNRSSEQDDPVYQPTPPRVVLGGSSRRGQNQPKVVSEEEDVTCDGPLFAACFDLNLWGSGSNNNTDNEPTSGTSKGHWRTASWKQQHDVPLAILDCANIINQEDRCAQFAAQMAPRVQTSLVRVASDYPNPTYAETILPTEVDPRMQDWIASQFAVRERPPRDGSYHLGKSRTVIVHEVIRGNWTWCTAWSPDGALLAVATENHHLAIVETTASTVWRVRHDRRIRSPPKNNSTQSIRSVAWGAGFIAIGGTGNAVSILSPVEPYENVLTVPGTGFVGCLHWRGDSNVLAIGSRLDFAMIIRIREASNESNNHSAARLEYDVLHKIEYKCWVNIVAFSHDGSYLAVGDSGGIVSVYDYDESEKDAETNMITWFKRKDSILSIEWSPDGKWLYAGGEDRSVTVIDTTYWEIVHRIGQDRWVQCIAASHGGSHVAIGGVSSEISILDVDNGWDSVMGIELRGLGKCKWRSYLHYCLVTQVCFA
jgi:WD40 repeat protein